MAGPNREWHVGDHGPGPTSWSDRGPKPMAAHNLGRPGSVVPSEPRPWPTSQGRDPHDKVTLELPLEIEVEISPRLCAEDDLMVGFAETLFLMDEGDEAVWLALMWAIEARWERM